VLASSPQRTFPYTFPTSTLAPSKAAFPNKMTVKPDPTEYKQRVGCFAALRSFFYGQSDKKTSNTTNEKVAPATNVEWVKREIPPPKVVPRARQNEWKWKGRKSCWEINLSGWSCYQCKNKVSVSYLGRNVGKEWTVDVKYVQRKSKQARTYVDIIPYTYDAEKFQDMDYEKKMESGDQFDICYEKYFASVTCAKCDKLAFRHYFRIYLQDGEKGGRHVGHLIRKSE